MTLPRAALAVALLAVAHSTVAADAPDLVTDRPDQTESTSIVTPGRWQVEMGYTHTEDRAAGVTAAGDALPETLVRIGLLAERLELRLIHGGWGTDRARPGGTLGSGLNDGAVGFKFGLLKESGLLPDVSLNAHAGLPIGAKARSSGRLDPDFRFLFANSLPHDLGLSYNIGAAWAPAPSIEYTLSLGFPIAGNWGAFVESFGDVPAAGGAGNHLLDGGITFGARDNLQFDVVGGAGLTDSAEDWFAGFGVSFRYPN